jgi:hypothetical protein
MVRRVEKDYMMGIEENVTIHLFACMGKDERVLDDDASNPMAE